MKKRKRGTVGISLIECFLFPSPPIHGFGQLFEYKRENLSDIGTGYMVFTECQI